MRISPINNNSETGFKSKFVPNKTLALAFNEAKEECSKETTAIVQVREGSRVHTLHPFTSCVTLGRLLNLSEL